MADETAPPKLADLVDMDSPEAVMDEVLFIMTLIAPRMDHTPLANAFNLTFSLYRGVWPAEKACNTRFHDLRHVTDTALAMARLIHGALIEGRPLGQRQILKGLVAALAHDAGYIQDMADATGTGAKYTAVHVERSVDFLERYGRRYGLTPDEICDCQSMVRCTDLDTDIGELSFASEAVALLGRLLGIADLIGQMADRIYLEKLFCLYHEFKEGQVGGFDDELDLLKKTLDFIGTMTLRIESLLDGLDRLALAHFRVRWNIPRNLYTEAIDRQRDYLGRILALPEQDPRDLLRRKQIVQSCFKG
ncbi:MAG: hypothetical protein P8X55_11745 [Desulfosarcinaceae bacterium]